MNKLLTLCAAIMLINIFSYSLKAAEEQQPRPNQAILVLDASGSMWGQIDKTPKINIAKKTLSQILLDWDKNTPLGLIAYGHNRKADCSDIETLIKPQKINTEEYLQKVKLISPKGKTPLSAAVKKAADELDYKNKKATVILISDGKETCHLDPCAEAKELEAKGIDFTAHVIGFDIPKNETAGLRCLAGETGGIYLEAANSDELTKALNSAKEIVTDKSVLKEGKASVQAPTEVVAGSHFEVEWTGPKNRLDLLIIKSLDNKKSFGYSYIGHEEKKSPASIQAPETPASYYIYYQLPDKRTLAKTTIKVIPAKAEVLPPATVLAGTKFDVQWSGPQNRFDSISLFSIDGKKQYSYQYIHNEDATSPTSLFAPEKPGQYEVRYYTYGANTLAKQTFEVIAATASVKAPAQVVAGSSFEIEWTGPKNRFDHVVIFSLNGKKKYDYQYVHDDATSPSLLTAPEATGQYEVHYYTYGANTLAKQTFEVIAATASVKAPTQVVAGSSFEVEWTGPKNRFDHVVIFSLNGKKKYDYQYVHDDATSPSLLTAPEATGQYEVHYYTYGANTLAKQTFEVIAATASVKAPAQVIAGSSFEVEWTGPQNRFDHVIIFSLNGKKKYDYQYVHDDATSPSILTAPEAAGQYEVRYYTYGENILAKQRIKVIK
ncbi:VWA domain-containing protein [Aliikangiella sp. IMCC44359]|uniref:VWA domain-containing protein n=1 Tax=Aliikangiella sp. IMCC44359 TaxID=3459125 RepID=UPI00403AAAE2